MDKQYILDEIRRTATANGGVPLGRARFRHETGIRESDWSGRFWTRWADAVKEAGFEPNALQVAFPEEELLDHFVILIRELGHFPTNAELRLKASQDPTFPSHNVWPQRFGPKRRLVKRLLEFCSQGSELADVRSICIAIAAEAEKDSEKPNLDQGGLIFSFVYLLKSGRYYKIGRSNAVGRRERELAIQLPEKAETLHVIRTDDPVGIEAYWHNRFASKRKNGEWFALDPADISMFKRRKFM
jgi:hypothetical protein